VRFQSYAARGRGLGPAPERFGFSDLADLKVHVPPPALCGDNAAMVAAAGYHLIQSGRRGELDADVFSRNR